MSIVVFLGPSLAEADARAILPDARYLPPAAAGDLYNALASEPSAFVIVDGFFDQVPSVWHKEVLFALSRGVPVYGASSLGALTISTSRCCIGQILEGVPPVARKAHPGLNKRRVALRLETS